MRAGTLRQPETWLPSSSVESSRGRRPCHMPPRYSAKQRSSSSCMPQPQKQMGRHICSLASFEIAEQM
eukprot:11905417-Ditylum_brightwellii.AAC.1